MNLKWLFATGAALSLALVTIPGIPSFSFDPTESVFEAATVCDRDAKPANLDFTLKDMDGNDVNLASYKGKVIVINFWATWCGPCKIEIPGFVELQDEYGSEGLALFGVSVDDPARAIKLFAEEYKVNYPMLVGLEEEAFMEAYGPLWGIPITIFISRDGMMCKTHAGLVMKEDIEEELKALL